MENNAEGAVADYLALCVRQIPCFAGEAILDPFADYFCAARKVSLMNPSDGRERERGKTYHPF